jgi:hypothetical protein
LLLSLRSHDQKDLAVNQHSEADVSHFLSSLDQSDKQQSPYQHWIISNLFQTQVVDEMLKVPFDCHKLDYVEGSREEHNPTRQYVNPSSIETYEACSRISNILRDPKVIHKFEEMGNIQLKDTLLRVEYAVDTAGFWLEPHTDIGVKVFTMLIYMSKEPDAYGWGTDIYESKEKHARTIPFNTNTALMFIPAKNTWHGFEPRVINGIRKTLIVNYVTEEWRNRHELTHPTQPVY